MTVADLISSDFWRIPLAALLAVPFCWWARRAQVLSTGGALAAAAIGVSVVASQGWVWLLPLFVFLGSGVLLGRLNKNAGTDVKHGKPRDAVQVVCNGGLYALLAVAQGLHSDVWMSISICVALCDTWASEIGMYYRWPTVNITTARRVPSGLSGGVSVPGTVGGFIGAFIMANVLWNMNAPEEFIDGLLSMVVNLFIYAWYMAVLVGFAMGGMLLDSLLGSLLQAKYDDGEGPRDQGNRLVSGVRWMTNDMVNLISNAATVGAAMLLL